MKLIDEFKAFAIQGNAIDLAIGVVIGAAFGSITSSLVKDIITPPLGLLIGGINFTDLQIPIGGDAAITYGVFLQALINFVIIAFVLFLIVRSLNSLKKPAPAPLAPEKSAELVVLEQIRDSLKNKTH